jgi:hypothetical protein
MEQLRKLSREKKEYFANEQNVTQLHLFASGFKPIRKRDAWLQRRRKAIRY